MVKFLIGNRDGVTIIGPSTVVKEVRRNPNKIELFTLPRMKGLKSKSIARRKTTKKKIASRKRTTRTVKRTVKRRRR